MGQPITAKNANKCRAIEWPDGLNCYSFAANCKDPVRTGSLACHPGAVQGRSLAQEDLNSSTGPKALRDACVSDGFEDASNGYLGILTPLPACDKKHYLVAAFIYNKSYHFIRQEKPTFFGSREWVHKPSAAQDACNFACEYLLGSDPTNVPWAANKYEFVCYLKAPLAGVQVARGDW